jgi:DNA-binding transcriptional ArsR family regulator
MRPLAHPAPEEITLPGVLYALADPVRLQIVRALRGDCRTCSDATPAGVPKSTQSFHFRVLRDAGLIRSERRGAEIVNTLRCAEIEAKFPGVLRVILKAGDAA